MTILALGFILIVVFVILLGIVVFKRKKTDSESEVEFPTIHASGIYSVIRKSPRKDVTDNSPSREEIIEFLDKTKSDRFGNMLTNSDKESLVNSWFEVMENNISEIEEADKAGRDTFFMEIATKCKECCKIGTEGGLVLSREDIYKHPELIPPFHVGCQCLLKSDVDWDSKETIILRPLKMDDDGKYKLPDWKQV